MARSDRIAISYVAGILFSAFISIFPAFCDDIPPERSVIEEDLKSGRGFSEETAREFEAKFGRASLPILNEILGADDTNPYMKGKVSFYLGMMGDVNAVPGITAFVNSPLPDQITTGHRKGLHFALIALGYLGRTSDDALNELKQYVSADHWANRANYSSVTFEGFSREDGFLFLRTSALAAISRAGNEKALNALELVQQQPDGLPDQYIQTAIQNTIDKIAESNSASEP